MSKKTKELVEASLIPALTDKGWAELIEGVKKIKITPETLAVDYDFLQRVWQLHKWLCDDLEEKLVEPKEEMTIIKSAYNPIIKQLEEILNTYDPQIAEINAAIIEKEREIKAGIEETNQRLKIYMAFVNTTTKSIAVASSVKELTSIQALVGLEMTKHKVYGLSFQQSVVSVACEAFLGLIQERKEMIKRNEILSDRKHEAEILGDISLAVSLKEQIEKNEAIIKENIICIGEKAYSYVSDLQKADDKLVSAAVKPRYSNWGYRVHDMNLLYKKMPDLVTLTENKSAISKFVKAKVAEGEIPEDSEVTINGLTIFRKLFYTQIAK